MQNLSKINYTTKNRTEQGYDEFIQQKATISIFVMQRERSLCSLVFP